MTAPTARLLTLSPAGRERWHATYRLSDGRVVNMTLTDTAARSLNHAEFAAHLEETLPPAQSLPAQAQVGGDAQP